MFYLIHIQYSDFKIQQISNTDIPCICNRYRYYEDDEWKEDMCILSAENVGGVFTNMRITMRNDIIAVDESNIQNYEITETLQGTPTSSTSYKFTLYYRER